MREHEKTASGAANTESGMESMNVGTVLLSNNQHTTEEPRRQGIVESCLRRGERNAIRSDELILMTGASGTRGLQYMIEEERRHGALILARPASLGGGYYLPDDGEAGHQELLKYYQALRRRCLSSLYTVKHIRRALGFIDGQLDLNDLEDSI